MLIIKYNLLRVWFESGNKCDPFYQSSINASFCVVKLKFILSISPFFYTDYYFFSHFRVKDVLHAINILIRYLFFLLLSSSSRPTRYNNSKFRVTFVEMLDSSILWVCDRDWIRDSNSKKYGSDLPPVSATVGLIWIEFVVVVVFLRRGTEIPHYILLWKFPP